MSLDSNNRVAREQQHTNEYGKSGANFTADRAVFVDASHKVHDILNPLVQPEIPPPNRFRETKIPTIDIPVSSLAPEQASLVKTTPVNAENLKQLRLAEAIERLQARRVQMDKLLAIASAAENDSMRLAQLREATVACPQFSAEECIAVINQSELVSTHTALRDALIVGGKSLLDDAGRSASLYTMNGTIGEGGMGKVKDGFILKEGNLIAVAIKEPKQLPTNPAGDSAEQKKQKDYYRNSYTLEATNAIRHLQTPMKNVMRVAFVSQAQEDTGLPIIAYEKIVDKFDKTTDFSSIADNPAISPSTKFDAFSHAVVGLDELHKRGVTHLDFKPSNTVLNAQGEGVVIDPGSMFSRDDHIMVLPATDSSRANIYRSMLVNGNPTVLGLAYTPQYVDLGKVIDGYKLGKPWSIADYYAVGESLNDILMSSGLIPSAAAIRENSQANATIKSNLQLTDDEYPPASIRAMQRLADELKDTTSTSPIRPLSEIATEIRLLSQQMKLEVDPFHQTLMQRRGVLPITTL